VDSPPLVIAEALRNALRTLQELQPALQDRGLLLIGYSLGAAPPGATTEARSNLEQGYFSERLITDF